MNDKELSNAIYELGVLLTDPLTGLIVTTIKQDFWEKFKDLELLEAWDCLVDEVNRVNTIIELHDELVERQRAGDLKKGGKMSEKRYYWSFFDDEVIVFDKKTNQDIICLEFGSDMNNEEVFNKLALIFEELVLRLNEQQATINRLKKKE